MLKNDLFIDIVTKNYHSAQKIQGIMDIINSLLIGTRFMSLSIIGFVSEMLRS